MADQPAPPGKSWLLLLLALIIIVALVLLARPAHEPSPAGESATTAAPLVVYCAHDAVFAEDVLRRFERESGIPLRIRYDTEATKSLSLVETIRAERSRPRCDVFWNNEILGTLDLLDEDLLEPYQGSGFAGIPENFRDPQGRWVGFAARLRVWVVNTDQMPATPEAVAARWAAEDQSRLTIARPLFGTTRTHYTVLWKLLGGDGLKADHASRMARGLVLAQSNGQTRNYVVSGNCDLGWTDTDDVFSAPPGSPIAMVPFRLSSGQTICIPNTVAIIRGSTNLPAAQRLVDFLLAPATELELARSAAKQIPLGNVKPEEIPADVQPLRQWAADAYPLGELGDARAPCLAWLKEEFLR